MEGASKKVTRFGFLSCLFSPHKLCLCCGVRLDGWDEQTRQKEQQTALIQVRHILFHKSDVWCEMVLIGDVCRGGCCVGRERGVVSREA
jgi:hypothetical protein